MCCPNQRFRVRTPSASSSAYRQTRSQSASQRSASTAWRAPCCRSPPSVPVTLCDRKTCPPPRISSPPLPRASSPDFAEKVPSHSRLRVAMLSVPPSLQDLPDQSTLCPARLPAPRTRRCWRRSGRSNNYPANCWGNYCHSNVELTLPPLSSVPPTRALPTCRRWNLRRRRRRRRSGPADRARCGWRSR